MGNILDCSTAVKTISVLSNQQEPAQPEPTIQEGPPVDTDSSILEDRVPLMESRIWTYLSEYYKRTNPIFNENPETPTFISNSSYIASVGIEMIWCLVLQSYANVILKFVNDWYNTPMCDKSEPIYIVELGAGQGRLGYLIIKKLLSLSSFFPPGVKLPFVYFFSSYLLVQICDL